MGTDSNRTRLTIDLPPKIKQHLRLVAAQRDISMREYIIETLEEKLARDLVELAEQEGLLALSARADTVLTELWDIEKDSAYDQI